MSGKRGSEEGLHPRPMDSRLPIMGNIPQEFQPPSSCFDFPHLLPVKKENEDTYPPIVTIDGRVDTDIDHLIDEEEDYTGPVVEIPSKFPKPHVFSVVEGSLDDDIDNYLNDDGTIEHTLVDAPKNFNPSELKDVNSKDASHKGLDLAKQCPTDMPLTNRSYNKTHTEQSENEVTNEIAEGELSINGGAQELFDQTSEDLMEDMTRREVVALMSNTRTAVSLTEPPEVRIDLKTAKSMDLAQLHDADKPMEVEMNAAGAEGQTTRLTREARARSEEKGITGGVDNTQTLMFCEEVVTGRGDFVFGNGLLCNKETNFQGIVKRSEDALDDLQHNLSIADESSKQKDRPQSFNLEKTGLSVETKEVARDKTEETNLKLMQNISTVCVTPQPDSTAKENNIQSSDRVDFNNTSNVNSESANSTAQSRSASQTESESESDMDMTESLVLLSKLVEIKGNKKKTKEFLQHFKQLVLESSHTKLEEGRQSSSQSLPENRQHAEKASELTLKRRQCFSDRSNASIASDKAEKETESGKEKEKPSGAILTINHGVSGVSHSDIGNVADKINKPLNDLLTDKKGNLSDSVVFQKKVGKQVTVNLKPPMAPSDKDNQSHHKHHDRSEKTIIPEGGTIKLSDSPNIEVKNITCITLNEEMLRSQFENAIGNNNQERSTTSVKESCDDKQTEANIVIEQKKEKSIYSSHKKTDRHSGHSTERKKGATNAAKRQSGVDFCDEKADGNSLAQKSALKCASLVSLNEDSCQQYSASPPQTRSTRAISSIRAEDPRHAGSRKRPTSSAKESKSKREKHSVDAQKPTEKEKTGSIKQSLKVALKVAEESVSAAAKVARALSFVMEATKPRHNMDTTSDEEGLERTYDKLISTMNRLSKETMHLHSLSPIRHNNVDGKATPLQSVQAEISKEHNLKSQKQAETKDYKARNKNDKQSTCKQEKDHRRNEAAIPYVVSVDGKNVEARQVMSPSLQRGCSSVHQRIDQSELEVVEMETPNVKLTNEKAKYEDNRGKFINGKHMEVRSGSEDAKYRSHEDKYSRIRSCDLRHRPESEGRRRSHDRRHWHEDKKLKPEAVSREKSCENRHKVSESKRAPDGAKEPSMTDKQGYEQRKESQVDGPLEQRRGSQFSLKKPQEADAHHHNHQARPNKTELHTYNKETENGYQKQATHGHGVSPAMQKKPTSRTPHLYDESQGQTQKAPHQHSHYSQDDAQEHSQKVPNKSKPHCQEETISHLQRAKPSSQNQDETPSYRRHAKPAPQSQDKPQEAAPSQYSKASPHEQHEAAKNEVKLSHDWRIPLTAHNANRKNESYFEQVILPKATTLEKSNKIFLRRLLRGSRVDYLGSDASETDSLEYDSNFNRVQHHESKTETVHRRKETSVRKAGHGWQEYEDIERATSVRTKVAFVKEWHDERISYYDGDSSYTSLDSGTKEDIKTAYSYRASHSCDRNRTPGDVRPDAAEPTADCRGHVHFSRSGQRGVRPGVRLCDSLSSSQEETEVTDSSTSGPMITVLKQNILLHQLPFPKSNKEIDRKVLNNGLVFSPIYEESSEQRGYESMDTDIITSVESEFWTEATKELNNNNCNMHEEMGSDLDVGQKVKATLQARGGQVVKVGDGTSWRSAADLTAGERNLHNALMEDDTLVVDELNSDTSDLVEPLPEEQQDHAALSLTSQISNNRTSRARLNNLPVLVDFINVKETFELRRYEGTVALMNQRHYDHIERTKASPRTQDPRNEPSPRKTESVPSGKQKSPFKTYFGTAEDKLKGNKDRDTYRNWRQVQADHMMCSHLASISQRSVPTDSWLWKPKLTSAEHFARSRIMEQERILRQNFQIMKRILDQEPIYSKEKQLKDYETNFLRHNKRYLDSFSNVDRQKNVVARANFLARQQAKAIDEFCSKGRSNNKSCRSSSLPPNRNNSIIIERKKSQYSQENFQKDFKDHCYWMCQISRHGSETHNLTPLKTHREQWTSVKKRNKNGNKETMKIDTMVKNKEFPYSSRSKTKT